MGRAAILVGPTVIIVIALIAWGIVKTITKSDKPTRDEQKLRDLAGEAYLIFNRMTRPVDIDNMDILTKDSSDQIVSWMNKYKKNKEGIK